MSILAAIAIFVLPLWLGYVVLRSAGLRFADDRYGFCGWVHVTGCLGIGLYLTVWLAFGLPLTTSGTSSSEAGFATRRISMERWLPPLDSSLPSLRISLSPNLTENGISHG